MGWFSDNFGFDIPLITGSGSITDALFGESDSPGLFSNPKGAWDNFKNGKTNEVNERIANQNLEYQKERNAIEDERYREETAYNRAFAEDERDYQRALQQQIFEREDTAIERQAESLSKLGINPLSQNMSGLGSGAVVSASVEPSASARGGSALHNDFEMSDMGILSAISPIMSFLNGVDNINTNGLQRDALREQNDYQRLLNQEKALQNSFLEQKLIDEQSARKEDNRHKKTINPSTELKEKSSAERSQRENVFQDTYGVTDNTNSYVRAVTDATKQAERSINYVQDKVGDLSKSATKTLVQSAKQKLKDYSDYLKNGWKNDKRRFKNFINGINNFGNKYLSENY